MYRVVSFLVWLLPLCHSFSVLPRTSLPHRATTINPCKTRETKLNASVIAGAVAIVDTFWQTSPYAAAALTCGFKASAADLVAQKRQYKKREEENQIAYAADGAAAVELPMPMADYKRNFSYLLYGALYQGVTQEFVYNHLYPFWFGTGTTIGVVLSKVLFDLCVQTTLITLPIAYFSKALIYGYSFKEAIRRYIDDIVNHGLLKKYFCLWGPVQCVTFSVVPEHWRVTFIAFVSFFWLIILSSIASKMPKPSNDDGFCELVDGQTCKIDG